MDPDPAPVSAKDLLRWSESLAAIARTGLGFTESLYERERFEEVLKIAADIRYHALEEVEAGVQIEEWLSSVGKGVPGYVTPKTAVGAVVGNDAGEILPCQADVKIIENAIVVACTVTDVPPALVQAAQSGP